MKTRKRDAAFSSAFKGENKRYRALLGGTFPLSQMNPALLQTGDLLCFWSINLRIISDRRLTFIHICIGYAWKEIQYTELVASIVTSFKNDSFLVFSFKKLIFSCIKKIMFSSKHFRWLIHHSSKSN